MALPNSAHITYAWHGLLNMAYVTPYIHINIYLITSILRNIASQLQCISASAAGKSEIPVTDEQYFSIAM